MRTYKPSYRMRRILLVMSKTGARYFWDSYNRWIDKDGKEHFWIDGESAPTSTVSDAMLRRGLVEESRPGPRFKLTYAITDAGKEALRCKHLTGYWINKEAGNFRCYECQYQFHIGDNLPANHPTRGIEVWEADEHR